MYKSAGYTIIELLVAIGIGVVIMFGVSTTFIGSLKTSATAVRTAQFDQEMRAAMGLMARDIKRAGYYVNAVNDVGKGTNTNTFITTVTGQTSEPMRIWSDITAGGVARAANSASTGTCITFAYDQAGTYGDGTLSLNSSDMRGFRLSNNTLQMRTSGGGSAPSANCNVGSWTSVMSPDVNVTALTFNWVDYTNSVEPTATGLPVGVPRPDHTKVLGRVVHIFMTANSIKEPTLTRTFEADVKVRNNVYDPTGN